MIQNILFDLDGTLTDSRVGIIQSVRHALIVEGFDAPPEGELNWIVGPPLRASFKTLVGSDDQALAERLLARYRERFEPIGMFENLVYDGVHDMLATLSQSAQLFLATSKPRVYAEKILKHFQLDQFFVGIFGAELDGSIDSKTDVIRALIDATHIHPNHAVMVGDREHDVMGAAANGIQTIGVTYGFGSEAELKEAGACDIAHTPAELIPVIARLRQRD